MDIYPVIEIQIFEETYFPPEEANILQYCDRDTSIDDIIIESGIEKEEIIKILLKYEESGILQIYQHLNEEVEPIDGKSYLYKVKNSLIAEGFHVENYIEERRELVGAISEEVLSSHLGGDNMNVMVNARYVKVVTRSGIKSFKAQISSVIKDSGKIIDSLLVLCSSDIPDDVKEWVQTTRIRRTYSPGEYTFQPVIFPVLFDLTTQEVYYYETRKWSNLFTYMIYLINKCVSTSLETSNLEVPSGRWERIAWVICLITIFCSILLLVL